MASPSTSTPWVPIWPLADPSPQIPSPTGHDGQWLTVAGGAVVWGAPPTPAGVVTADTAWKILGVDLALQNGWVNYDTPYGPGRYRKTASGLVIMDGLIRSGTLNVTAFTMPVGYRPTPQQSDGSGRDLIFQLACGGGAGSEGARISSDGNVRMLLSGSQPWIALNGIVYYAG